jgi:hypothetical protein
VPEYWGWMSSATIIVSLLGVYLNRQSIRYRRKQSTGAKTPEGKKRSSQNAYKTGKSLEFREFIKFINRLLKDQKDLIR